jgi:peptidoglycan/xylan/chitin deacetylase (PgdA/CDA1 family)
MEELERACGFTLGASEERRLADGTLMTWEQIAALRRAGMDVQSHTCSHRVLDTLSDDALAGELRESRRILERVMGEPVRALSYPVGRPLTDAPRIKRAVADAGYELGFSNGTGVNALRAFDALDVRRIAMDAGLGDAFFRTMLALPWLAYRP